MSQSFNHFCLSLGRPPFADNGDTGAQGHPVLTLVCPRCGESLPSAMQSDRPTFAAIPFDSVVKHCSACGKLLGSGTGTYSSPR